MLVLVIGGVRSGKSEVAERLAAERGEPVVYAATGWASDEEMAGRIARHRARRPAAWRTVETDDPEAVLASSGGATVLVDSLGAWIARLMEREGLFGDAPRPGWEERVLRCVRSLGAAAAGRPGLAVVVAEESGMGLVPIGDDGAATRRWLDLTGRASQVLAASAAVVKLVVAGRTLDLGPPVPSATAAADGLRAHGDAMVPPGALDFAVNVVPGPPPAWLRAEIEASLPALGRYPDSSAAVEAIARRHGRPPEEVLPLNGGAEAYWLLGAALRPSHAVCVHPSFTEGEVALGAAGCPVARVLRDPETFALDPAAVPAAADLVVVCNPNNPTGNLDLRGAVEELARPGRVVVVDEAFMELCAGEDESLASRPLPGFVVLRSLTKVWSIPGLRAGYLVGPPGVVRALAAVRQPWPVSGPALAAIAACCGRPEAARAVADRVARWRHGLMAGLGSVPGVRLWPAAANFVLVEVPGGDGVRAGLRARGIAVRAAGTFPGLGAGHLRIAVRGPQDTARLVEALREVVRPELFAAEART